jgi:hypothetical protein
LLRSNSKEHSRQTRALPASPTLRLLLFVSLSTLRPYGTGAAAQRKSNRLRVMGMKNAPSAYRLSVLLVCPMTLSDTASCRGCFPVPRLNASENNSIDVIDSRVFV